MYNIANLKYKQIYLGVINLKKLSKCAHKNIAVILALFAVILSLIFFFLLSINKIYKDNLNSIMRNSCDDNKEVITNSFNEIFNLLHTISNNIATFDEINSKDALNSLTYFTKNYHFVRMAVTTPDGISYTDDGFNHDTTERDYFIDGMKGKDVISEFLESKVDKEGFVAFACPIYKNNIIVGVLRCTVNREFFTEILQKNAFNKVKDVLLINSNGTILTLNSEDKTDNFYEILTNSKLKNQQNLSQFENDLINGKSKLIQYNYKNEDLFACYKPIGVNNWFVVSISSKEYILGEIEKIIVKFAIVILGLIVAFVLAILVFYKNQKRVYEQIRINEERYRIISEQSDDIIFEYNIAEKSIVFSDNYVEHFGYEPILEDIPDNILTIGIIHQADANVVSEFFDNIANGGVNNKAKFRMKKFSNNYIWCKIVSTTIYDKLGKPIKAVGKLQDIDRQTREKETLREQARRDSLTGLYNKLTTKNNIEMYIDSHQKEKAAFIYFDIDDFKKLNDKFGHDYGDKVIVEIAEKLQILFRSSDILGRIGDDEFVVFLKNVLSDQFVLDKVYEIQNLLRSTFVGDELDTEISGSIGVSFFPEDASEFTWLYKKADTALYKAKNKGKDCFEFYKNMSN